MQATIWHNPDCGTSRKTLALLQGRSDIDLTIIEYLQHPPTREKLVALYARAGMSARDGLRTTNSPAAELCAELGLMNPDVSDETIIDAMMRHPILINRPLVETPRGVRLCRPPETVLEII